MSKWVTLSPEQAKTHPRFGIKGWAQAFRVASVVTPCLWLLSAIGRLHELIDARGALIPLDYLLLLPPVVFFVWSGWNAHLLGKHATAFFTSFYALLALGPIIIIVVRLFWMANADLEFNMRAVATIFLSLLVGWIFWSTLIVLYLTLSRRINVTLRNRVRATAAFLKSPE